ncbi:hypothetical protein ANO11243_006620 [Dothideomycetidae sp. 11243]|nr:hypothetical protein ANO11243_006620 [fungal sp. No.11243]
MDSMRSLNRSLPRTSPQRRTQQHQQQNQPPPEDLLAAFKSAALSVTTLYRSAASLQIPARNAGYQEALEDILSFLDRENLGLGDGEGWRVRQWATERLDGNNTAQLESDEDEEEQPYEEKAEESTTVPIEAKESNHEEDLASSVELLPKEDEPVTNAARPTENRQTTPSLGSSSTFTFRSPQSLPSNYDKEISMDGVVSENGHESRQNDANGTTHTSSKHDSSPRHVRSRPPRSSHQRSSTSLRNGLGAGAGSKRRFPLGDFFDLSGINFDGRDGTDRASKRNRH